MQIEIFANQSVEGAGTLISYRLYGYTKYVSMVFPFFGQVSHQQECGGLL